MVDERVEFILNNARGKNVLHVGCADWPYTEKRISERGLLHDILNSRSRSLVGVDVSNEGLEIIKKHNKDMELYHVNEKHLYIENSYDVIVATEVIEHVDNLEDFILFLAELANDDAEVIITTPNAYSLKGALRGVFGREYQHPDHTQLFSTKTLGALLKKRGLEIVQIDYYLSNSPSISSKVANFCMRGVRSLFSRRVGDGIMVIAKKQPR